MKKKFKRKIHTTDPARANRAISNHFLTEIGIAREKSNLDDNDKKILNEKSVLIYLSMQKEKAEFGDTIEEEYIEKVVMFGYLVVSIRFLDIRI